MEEEVKQKTDRVATSLSINRELWKKVVLLSRALGFKRETIVENAIRVYLKAKQETLEALQKAAELESIEFEEEEKPQRRRRVKRGEVKNAEE